MSKRVYTVYISSENAILILISFKVYNLQLMPRYPRANVHSPIIYVVLNVIIFRYS